MVDSDALIREMTKVIVQETQPKRVILFGSRARRDATPDSDADFLIVQDATPNAAERRRTSARLGELFARYPFSQDFLFYGVDDVDRWKDARNHVIAHALRDGRVLYERP